MRLNLSGKGIQNGWKDKLSLRINPVFLTHNTHIASQVAKLKVFLPYMSSCSIQKEYSVPASDWETESNPKHCEHDP